MSYRINKMKIILLWMFFLIFGMCFNSDFVYADAALIGIDSFSIKENALVSGKEATVILKVHNSSTTTSANDIVLSISSTSGKLFPAYGTDNQYYIGHLNPNETKSIEVSIRAGKDLNEDGVDLVCAFSYMNETSRTTNSVVIVLPVRSVSPVFIEVDNFSLGGGMIVPGKDVLLTLDVHNTSTAFMAENVILTLKSASGKIYPSYGTDNQYYIGSLDIDEKKTIEIPLSVGNGLNSNGVELICEFEYIGERGTSSNEVSIVLPSTGGTPVILKNLEIGTTAIVNSKTLLSVTLWNNTSEDITDACLFISGDVSQDSKEIKLDTLNSLQNFSDDCQITFINPGKQEISVTLKYTDLNGQSRISELGNYTVTVNSQASELITNTSSRKIKVRGLVVAGTALLLVCGVVFMYIKKR